jgi:DNA-binding NarL/FixJ family response regulator
MVPDKVERYQVPTAAAEVLELDLPSAARGPPPNGCSSTARPCGTRRATRAHPLGLTPRECEVLELICERQTNAQIARALFISAKTVDHHVSAVLAKLGVENREAAADMSRNLTA